MQHWTREHENGVTAYVEPNAEGAGFCYRCAGEGQDLGGRTPYARPALATVADAQHHADVTAHPDCTGHCRAWTATTADALTAARGATGRHWLVGDEGRLFGVDVDMTNASGGDVRACAVPFTVDATDLFQYEDNRRERLEFYADTPAAALAGAIAFLRGRYKSVEPASVDEIPATVCLHAERIVLRSRDRFAQATLDEPEPLAATV